LIATTTLGGKAGWTPAAGLLVQPCEALFEEPFAPLADDLTRRIEPCGDLIIAETLGSIEDDLGPHHISIR
jgi:hypothetical protein